jgi:hypothetical protein
MAPNPDYLVGIDVLDRTRLALERYLPSALQVCGRLASWTLATVRPSASNEREQSTYII